MSVNKL